MKMTEVRFAAGTPIDGYGPGQFRIGGYQHLGGLLILPRRVAQWTPQWPLTIACVADIIAAAGEIDIVLIGITDAAGFNARTSIRRFRGGLAICADPAEADPAVQLDRDKRAAWRATVRGMFRTGF